MPIRQPDLNSFYTLPKYREPFAPQPVISPILDPTDAQALRLKTLQELSHAITPAKIQRFVDHFLNGSRAIHIRDFPPETFAHEKDLPWLIYTIAYGNHPETRYGLEPVPGEPVELGPVRVKPFRLVRR
jgi:hypothetical protein